MDIITAGTDYWQRLLDLGVQSGNISNSDQYYLRQAIEMARKVLVPVSSSGKVPFKVMQTAKAIYEVKDKLASFGITA